jgi:hypothetical protein
LRLTHASIAAPFAGSMVARLVTPGQAVNAGTPLFTLAARTDRLTVQVPLSAAERLAPMPAPACWPRRFRMARAMPRWTASMRPMGSALPC